MAIKQGIDTPRFALEGDSNAADGHIVWSPLKTLWVLTAYIGTAIAVIWYLTFENLIVFLVSTAGVLCFGHSLGMHRRLIHNSFDCPKWLEYVMVYLGTLVGLAGPLGMIHTHDLRDWAQRQQRCHDYFAHRRPFLQDAFWQLGCDITLAKQPSLQIESHIRNDRFYRFIDATWMWQQIPVGLLLYFLGGTDWLLWGGFARVASCVTGHWLIGHFAHRQGHRHWHVEGAGVQGYNIKFAGLITFGECWHNNHHAFPGSAKIGLESGQSDPGWWVLRLFEKVGLVWNLQTPETLAHRPELKEI